MTCDPNITSDPPTMATLMAMAEKIAELQCEVAKARREAIQWSAELDLFKGTENERIASLQAELLKKDERATEMQAEIAALQGHIREMASSLGRVMTERDSLQSCQASIVKLLSDADGWLEAMSDDDDMSPSGYASIAELRDEIAQYIPEPTSGEQAARCPYCKGTGINTDPNICKICGGFFVLQDTFKCYSLSKCKCSPAQTPGEQG